MSVILLMGFAVVTSADNGSSIGNMIKTAPSTHKVEKMVDKVFNEVLR